MSGSSQLERKRRRRKKLNLVNTKTFITLQNKQNNQLNAQEISGYGNPMRQSSDGRLRQMENAGYGPLQSSDQWETIRTLSHWSELWRGP